MSSPAKWVSVLLLAALLIPLAPSPAPRLSGSPAPGSPKALPPLMLWAWERPEDLSFIDPARTGVAYLAGTATLRGEEVLWKPRFQPLKVPGGTCVVAVIRVEWNPRRPPACNAAQAERLAARLLRVAGKPDLSGLQVDFDAAVSQRGFYAEVLTRLRRSLPAGFCLSATALASWRLDERWACTLPVDEAVIMLFRMGPIASEVRRRLSGGSPPCGGRPDSFGVSLDEPLPSLPAGRVYCFNPRPWTPGDLAELEGLLADARRRGAQASAPALALCLIPDPLSLVPPPKEVSHAVQR